MGKTNRETLQELLDKIEPEDTCRKDRKKNHKKTDQKNLGSLDLNNSFDSSKDDGPNGSDGESDFFSSEEDLFNSDSEDLLTDGQDTGSFKNEKRLKNRESSNKTQKQEQNQSSTQSSRQREKPGFFDQLDAIADGIYKELEES